MMTQRVGRNEPCPCRSGRKFKQCCLQKEAQRHIPQPSLLRDGPKTNPFPRQPAPPVKPKIRVSVGYEFSDGIGIGTVSYSFDISQQFLLTSGLILTAERVEIGMQFLLEDGAIATVTDVKPPREVYPLSAAKDANGNTQKRILGTIKYSGCYPVMSFVVGGLRIETTGGHPFYSLDRSGWVDAESLRLGERIETAEGVPQTVTEITPPQPKQVDLHNLEVEDYHTYFVGHGGSAVWSHNGLEMSCAIPKPKEVGLFDDIPHPDGPLGVGARALRKDQYVEAALPLDHVVHDPVAIRAVIGDGLLARGSHDTVMSGIYSFMRQNGEAGFQAVTRDPTQRVGIVTRNMGLSEGSVLAAIDISRLPSNRVFDLRSDSVRTAFMKDYPEFVKMYDRIASEGVVAIRGTIPSDAVSGLLRHSRPVKRADLESVFAKLFGGGG